MRRVAKCLVVCVIGLAGYSMLRAGDLTKVPDNIRELMQDRKYDDAAAAIDMLLADQDEKTTNPDYLVCLKGRALLLAGKHRLALDTFARVERDYANSPWVRRAKFGQAAALLKIGDFEAAEHIYEEEVKFLLSTERKHEIASIYLEFADAYFEPPKPADGDAISQKKPDYAKALNFYRQALAIGPQADRRMEVEFRIARCHQELGQHAEAAAAYQAFLKAHPKSKLDVEARYQLGAVQLAQGQNVEARRTWKDLLDAYADHKVEPPKELLDAYPNRQTQRLAEAAYGLSHTYGLPNPPSKEDLELGVAAAERFIANFPDIKLAARSALEVAQSLVSQNRQDEAIARLKKLLADPKYRAADGIPDARVLLGFAYQRQKKFDDAIAAWQEYLAKHAAHPSWAQVQQAIIDTEFLTALEVRRAAATPGIDAEAKAKKFDEARKIWEAFLARYPLDGRAASIMLEFGLMNQEQEKYDAAIADWSSLVSKYPNTEEASRGQYLIGLTYEEKLGKFDEALAAYRKLTWGQFAPRAVERISRLTRQELAIETERVFRTNQQPRVKITTRNIKQVTVKAYRVDLETYFRKMHLARGIEALDIALIDPEKSWTFDVPNYSEHQQLTSYIEVPLEASGVMAVTVANEPKPTESGPAGITVRPQEATTMVMQSDLDILVKCSRNELFVFAENMRTGKPFAGVKLLVSDGNKVFAEGTTNDEGVFVAAVADSDKTWEPLKSSNDIRVFAVGHRAGVIEGNKNKKQPPTDWLSVVLMRGSEQFWVDGQGLDENELAAKLKEAKAERDLREGVIIIEHEKQSPSMIATIGRVAKDAGIELVRVGNLGLVGVKPGRREIRNDRDVNELATSNIIVRVGAAGTIRLDHAGDTVRESDLVERFQERKRQQSDLAGVEILFESGAPPRLAIAAQRAARQVGLAWAMNGFPPVGGKDVQAEAQDHRASDPSPPQFASNVVGLQGIEFAQGISSKGYIYTERPTYRAGQLVHIRGVVRWVKGDEYFFDAGKKFKLDVYDSRGKQIRSEGVTLGEFGSFATRFVLPAESPQGEYRLHVHDPAEPDKHNYQGTFGVHEYQLQPVLIEIDTPQKVYYRGDQVAGTIKLRYYYGSPVADREIRYVLPDGTIHSEKTNASGEVPFKFDTREFREDQMLTIAVQYPEVNLQAGLNLFLSTHGFRATVATARDVYLSGETFDVTVNTTDAAGKKTGEKLTLAIVQRTEVQGQVGERTVEEQKVATEKETGSGRATIKIAAAGTYILRASGTDRFGNPVSAERTVTVSGDDDSVRLRILSDRHHYKAGDTATVQVHWREEPALALVSYQGARVLGYRLVELAKGPNKLEIPITEKLAPNFDLTVSVMSESGNRESGIGNRQKIPEDEPRIPNPDSRFPSFHEASSPFEVERPLVVTLKPNRDRVRPGDEVEVAITATDPQGKPVRAELSLAMIEKSLLEMFPDELAAITQFFEGAHRTSALRTAASCTFRYTPSTHDISQTLIAEATRSAVAEMERLSRSAISAEEYRLSVIDVEKARTQLEAGASAFGVQNGDLDHAAGVVMQGFAPPGNARDGQQMPALAGRSGGRSAIQHNRQKAAALGDEALAKRLGDQTAAGLRRAEVDFDSLQSMGSVDRPSTQFSDDWGVAVPDPKGRQELTEWRKNVRFGYFSQADNDALKAYAGSVLGRTEGKQSYKATQLNLLFDDGMVNYVDARSVQAGKLSERLANGGVTVLPEGLVRETGYWNPAVITDDDGHATVSITMPDRSTAWQLAARGTTTATLTGQATAELVAKKDLFGELKLPLAFVDGDGAQILATIHNDAVQKGKIEVSLKTTITGKSREEKRTIDVDKTGAHELTFDRNIAGTGEAVFELAIKAVGAPAPLEDIARDVVPIRPYGIPVFSTTGGSANSNMTAWISPPPGMPVRDPSLQIVIGPSVERSLLDVVLGSMTAPRYLDCHRMIVGESALERSTSDLMASLGLLKLLNVGVPALAGAGVPALAGDDAAKDAAREDRLKAGLQQGSPEATALADRIRSSIGYLVSSQNDDGGWHWSAARGAKQGSSDRNASARALWSLALARKAGFAVPDDAFNKAITFVQTAFTAARENDYDGKAMLLHSLAAAGRGDFAYANRLYRSRTSLSQAALAYLSLAFVEMDRKEIAREVLDLLAPKLAASLTGPDEKLAPAGSRRTPSPATPTAEVQALYLHALNAVLPGDAKVKAAADWLMAHRAGSRWAPERATGPATLALSDYFTTARFAAEHYKLKVFVNDAEVAQLDLNGTAGSHLVEVPKELLARGEKLPDKEFPQDARKQRVNFELTGRGRFTFNCVYSGFVAADQLKSTVNSYHIERHYEPAPLEFDGKEVPRGFDLLTGPFNTWRNPVTELPVGRRAQVLLYYYPIDAHLIPEDERDYVVITEPIPSGCTVLEKSITGQFDRYEIGPGYITFYVGNRSQPNEIRFDLYGYTAGKFRTAPTIVRNFYDPERMVVSEPRPITVLTAGQKPKDEYKVTPRELYELGKRHLVRAKGNRESAVATAERPNPDSRIPIPDYETAGKYLADLFEKYQLKPEIYKETAQMLFEVSLALGKSPDIVRYFEVIKEKWPELEVPFEQIVRVGAAYRELNEYERSYLVFRATAEGSFIRESAIGGFLESQGEFERSVAVMDRILREYPAEPYIASATYALAQRVYAMAPNAAGDVKLRERKMTKVDLIRDAIGRLDDFLTAWPDDPAADQASFSLASALVELELWPAAITRANRYAGRFPTSEYLDSFWYIIGYSHFARGEHRAALEMCQRVAEATRTDAATGREVESRNKWRAIYISGQVYHSLGEPAEAIREYNRVADRFPDAKETIGYFTRKAMELPEITTVKPQADAEVELKFRNVASCEVKVYRIDLLKFGLLQRDLSNITKINLAGIRPLHETTVELGDGKDYRDRTKQLELPLQEEGAYLVVCRGEDLHTSGLVLVTPLVLEVQEEASSGRVRASVKNTVTEKYSSEVQVKVIGSRNDKFKDGQTDLRGVFVADGIQGRSTVIARAGDGQYAFHRGQVELGPPPAPAKPPAPATADPGEAAPQQELLQDLFKSNRMIQEQKGKELRDIYENKSLGVPAQRAF